MSNENYELIHADEGVQLEWDEECNALIVSGKGRCELGEVAGNLVVEDEVEVEVVAEKVEGKAVSFGESTLTAQTVKGDAAEKVVGEAESKGASTLTAGKVGGDARSRDDSTLEVGGERNKEFTVTIRAVITKDVTVQAESEQAACELAHEAFSVLNDGPENYEQETVRVEEVQKESEDEGVKL